METLTHAGRAAHGYLSGRHVPAGAGDRERQQRAGQCRGDPLRHHWQDGVCVVSDAAVLRYQCCTGRYHDAVRCVGAPCRGQSIVRARCIGHAHRVRGQPFGEGNQSPWRGDDGPSSRLQPAYLRNALGIAAPGRRSDRDPARRSRQAAGDHPSQRRRQPGADPPLCL
ncbi:hypothetical protein D3C81_1642010 [compost metagenome]